MLVNHTYNGHALEILRSFPDGSVDCCVTSPPYWGLRDYGTQPIDFPAVTFRVMEYVPEMTVPALKSCHLGLESSPVEFIAHLVAILTPSIGEETITPNPSKEQKPINKIRITHGLR